jgi:threonine synthase
MIFVSTRGGDEATFSEAVITGLAGDGGLFVPETMPDISSMMKQWRGLSYPELAYAFLSLFATDIPENELRDCIDNAYSAFSDPKNPAPMIELEPNLYVMELFHGPTLAFKDFALQLLGQLYGWHISETGQSINILGATSGDTGSAAIYGMLNQPATHSFILYPAGGISALQERQIACTGSEMVHPLAIMGSFDDAQSIVKQIFGDVQFSSQYSLTAVNSINIARILAQCIYYLDAVLKLDASTEHPIEFLVPTGNFGNVLAGWMLTKMGIQGLRFCVSTNINSVVADFFDSGEYCPDKVIQSLAPSMDIQQASNFERWLWWHFEGDSLEVNLTMNGFDNKGYIALYNLRKWENIIRSISVDDKHIEARIKETWDKYNYIIDPHTACAFEGVSNYTYIPRNIRRVVLATAHPAKFPHTIESAIDQFPRDPSLELLKQRPVITQVIPANVDVVKRTIQKTINDERGKR